MSVGKAFSCLYYRVSHTRSCPGSILKFPSKVIVDLQVVLEWCLPGRKTPGFSSSTLKKHSGALDLMLSGQSEVNSQEPRGGRREPSPANYSLTSSCSI